jgi:hypothetical protein
MIVEIALGIVLAVFILAALPTILLAIGWLILAASVIAFVGALLIWVGPPLGPQLALGLVIVLPVVLLFCAGYIQRRQRRRMAEHQLQFRAAQLETASERFDRLYPRKTAVSASLTHHERSA